MGELYGGFSSVRGRLARLVLGVLGLVTALLGAEGELEQPVGMVLSVSGDVGIDAHQVETVLTAVPGAILFSGDTIINRNGSVEFTFCPRGEAWTLRPGGTATLEQGRITADAGVLAPAQPPAFCELPMLRREPLASGGIRTPSAGTMESRIAALPTDRQQALRTELGAAEAYLKLHTRDIGAMTARAVALQRAGLEEEAAVEYRAVSASHKDAVWARGVERIPRGKPAAEAGGKTYALVIGISRYKHDPPIASLRYADRDAKLFAELLSKPLGGSLRPDQRRLLRNEEATRAAIDAATQQLAREASAAGKQNTLILYIAAHGVFLHEEEDPKTHRVKQAPWILTYESNPQDPKTTGYPIADFRKMLVAQADVFRRVLVFVDVCHAGQIGPISSSLELEPGVRAVFAGESGDFGMLLATKEFAYEAEQFGGGHGAFTYALVDGWNGAASPKDSTTLDLDSLAMFIHREVTELTRRAQVPEEVEPNPDLVIATDVRKEGVHLEPARPLDAEEVKRLRRPVVTRGAVVEASASSDSVTSTRSQSESFESAMTAGLLLPDEPGSAWQILDRIEQSGTIGEAELQGVEDRLRVALEDRGQETVLRYLEGDQVPPRKTDFVTGAKYFAAASQLAPESVFDESRRLFCEGRALIFDHAYGSARDLLERSVRLDPLRAYSYNALGIAYLEQIAQNGATFDLAIRAFHDAIRFAPYWAYPRHNLALAYVERGEYAAAIREYESAMLLAPHYTYLPYNLGLLYQRLNQTGKAQQCYQRALDTLLANRKYMESPGRERAEILNAMGTLEVGRERFRRAEKLFRDALADNPQSTNARRNLAQLLSRAGESSEAERYWQANLHGDANDLPSLLGYADYLVARDRVNEASALYLRILEQRPHYAAVRLKLVGIYKKVGDNAGALLELEAMAADSPDNPSTWELIGDLQARLGHADEAQKAWVRAESFVTGRTERKRLEKKLRMGIAGGTHSSRTKV